VRASESSCIIQINLTFNSDLQNQPSQSSNAPLSKNPVSQGTSSFLFESLDTAVPTRYDFLGVSIFKRIRGTERGERDRDVRGHKKYEK